MAISLAAVLPVRERPHYPGRRRATRAVYTGSERVRAAAPCFPRVGFSCPHPSGVVLRAWVGAAQSLFVLALAVVVAPWSGIRV